METYSVNSNLVLDSGENITTYLDDSLSGEDITTTLDNARERAYRTINEDWLRDKTATVEDGATLSIVITNIPKLKQIEIDLALGNILMGAFIAANIKSSKVSEFYTKRAESTLKILRFPSSATTPVAGSDNTGDGTISEITTNGDTTKNETWILIAQDSVYFTVMGNKTENLPSARVGYQYPELANLGADYGFKPNEELDDYGFFPVRFLITAGSTPFAIYDELRFQTFASSRRKKRRNTISLS